LEDENYTGRGTALLDANGDGLLDIVYGNWNGVHRLFIQSRNGDSITFSDQATSEMAETSRIRTVIVADFDNDGNRKKKDSKSLACQMIIGISYRIT